MPTVSPKIESIIDCSMDKPQPSFDNNKRRRNLALYTLLAMLSYQLPLSVFYLAKVIGIAKYDYATLNWGYFSFMACSLTALIAIRFKEQITKKFIYLILYIQASFCTIVSFYLFYVMSDLRYLVPIGCLTLLMFIFIQSTLLVSFISILAIVAFYLSSSYIGIVYNGQPGLFVGDVLYILMYVPVCIFIAYMSKRMQDQQKKIRVANSTLKSTHKVLEETHKELEENNAKMIESIRYAEMIQRSLLPGIDRIKAVCSENMFIWMPKDIVGGDIFYTYSDHELSLIALMDCTGHGVPGALLTMVVYSEIRKIIMDEECRDPSEILSRLNRAVKDVFHHIDNGSNANDGLDAAVCIIDYSGKKVIYAGARIPLFYCMKGKVHKLDGDKQSIGYKDSEDHFVFTNHIIKLDEPCSFYLKTDGYTDQLGGGKRLRFGTGKFKDLIMDNHDKSFTEQRQIFLQTLLSYQSDNEQMDDITLIGFRL